eukprot:8175374-Pyramimonas_sp.AAC.1
MGPRGGARAAIPRDPMPYFFQCGVLGSLDPFPTGPAFHPESFCDRPGARAPRGRKHRKAS